eukprot:6182054-Pleurochrysis_carterae.AAC.2
MSFIVASAAGCMHALVGIDLPRAKPAPPAAREVKQLPKRLAARLSRTANLGNRKPEIAPARGDMRTSAPLLDKGARRCIDETKAVHRQFWRCLRE